MKITFHGAARTVTGSQHYLEINGSKLLLDCGLYQGPRKESYARNREFPFNPRQLDAVILSHAHIDHSGNLPNLVKNGYQGPIYTTPASAHLSRVMLLDSAHIQEADAEYINRKQARRAENHRSTGQVVPLVEPIYTTPDAELAGQYLKEVPYAQPFEPMPGVVASLVDAGHILGSAAVVLDIDDHGRKLRLWFSGDIGRRGLPLIKDPILPERPDYMIMESTYGDKVHRDPQRAFEELRDVVTRTVNRGGKVIIPAFAVGRTQELVYALHQMIISGDIPRIPIVVDSPLAINVTEVFNEFPDCYDEETWAFIRSGKHREVFGFDLLIYTRSTDESKALNTRKEPMVIISASGMAETGRILHHLKNNIEDPKNTVLIVSWQAPYTLGRRIADREKQVKIFGEIYDVRAEVSTIGGLSAHAGQNMLVEYAQTAQGALQQIFLVHGEAGPAEALRQRLADSGLGQVAYPELHSSVEI
jgi:metallo-beta-lactamase family protein